MRQFGLSRVTFREMANNGLIPGVKSILVKHLF
jgi:small subunit ribosomal protein S14